jgi:hypothetical protein
MTNGIVHSTVLSGNTLFLSGEFTLVGASGRNNVAAIDVVTKTVTDWNPSANGPVYDLKVSGNTVFAGGVFSTIGGQPRSCLAALDATTGNATSWNPQVLGGIEFNPDPIPFPPSILDMVLGDDVLYVTGKFAKVGATNVWHLAKISTTTGVAANWQPIAGGSHHTFRTRIATDGARVYVAGGEQINVRGYDAITAQNAGFLNGNQFTRAMVVIGSALYAGGDFTEVNSTTRNRLSSYDPATGVLAWNPDADGYVSALAVEGSTVFAGGGFTTIGGQSRAGLAAIDAASGAPNAWNPSVDNAVLSITPNGSTVYLGGAFTSVNSQPFVGLVALDYPLAVAVDGPIHSAPGLLLHPAAPHPMRDRARLSFVVPRSQPISLDIVDLAGRLVRRVVHEQAMPAGKSEVIIERAGLSAGLYFLTLRSVDQTTYRKLIVLP